ncbi:MAG: hypothetical protein PVS2B2_00590 [Candidatus Acidiferrum sp.]
MFHIVFKDSKFVLANIRNEATGLVFNSDGEDDRGGIHGDFGLGSGGLGRLRDELGADQEKKQRGSLDGNVSWRFDFHALKFLFLDYGRG